MANYPTFTDTPKVGIVVISTANTNRNGTGTIGTVFTAGTDGSYISKITIKATGTTTAGMVRLFIHDGTNARLLREVDVSALTPSATVKSFSGEITYSEGLIIPTGYSLGASTHNAEDSISLQKVETSKN
jgi:hypothetical protein